MEWYLQALRRYAEFGGRSRRKEYWFFVLFNVLISIALGIFDNVIGTVNDMGSGFFSGLYSLGVFIPSIAVAIRRLHDTGRVGWWLLIALIPLIGAIVLIVFFVQDSESGPNDWGPSPKGASDAEAW